MSSNRHPLRKQHVTAGIVGLALIACIGMLLMANYSSQVRIQSYALERLRLACEKRAGAISYFYTERKEDLKWLAEQRTVTNFFENRALGMSLQYGLRDSLNSIGREFDRFLEEKKVGGKPLYKRIMFLENDGRVLVDRSLGNPGEPGPTLALSNSHTKESEPEIALRGNGQAIEVLASIPCVFKDGLAGHILAWVAYQAAYDYLLMTVTSSSKGVEAVTGESGQVLYVAHGYAAGPLKDLQLRFGEMIPGESYHYKIRNGADARTDVIAVRMHIQGTPFYLVSVTPSEEILSWLTPAQHVFIMSAVCLVILGVLFFLNRMHTREFVLEARLDEAAKAREALEEKNRQLQKEVNERIQAEEALRKSEEKFRELVDLLPEIVFEMELDGRVTFANQNALEAYQYTQEDIERGIDAFDTIVPEDRNRALQNVQRLLQGEEIGLMEFSAVRKDGSIFPVMIRVGIIHRDGTPIGVRGVVVDVTQTKQLESQLIHAHKMEAVGILAGGVAHDFNNLLQAVQGYADLLMMDKTASDREYDELMEISRAAHKGGELTRQLLTFSRKVKGSPKPTDLNLVIEQVRRLLERTIPKMIRMELRLVANLGKVLVDPNQIEQVLLNLALNAKDAMPEGGRLVIETFNRAMDRVACGLVGGIKPGWHVVIRVSDSGHGMTRETREHIFDPFFTTKSVGAGTGLGLSMVYGIVKSHGGQIVCESEPGKGTVFSIYFPTIEDPKEETFEEEIDLLPNGNQTVLLVDDESTILDLGKRILERFGYTVLTAETGEKALEVYTSHPSPINLVILDLIMPGIGGRRTMEELLKMSPGARILVASGYCPHGRTEDMLAFGARGFLTKPFDTRKMLQAVQAALTN